MPDNNIGPGKVLDNFQSLIFGNEASSANNASPDPKTAKDNNQSADTHYRQNNPQQQKMVNPPSRPVQKIFRK